LQGALLQDLEEALGAVGVALILETAAAGGLLKNATAQMVRKRVTWWKSATMVITFEAKNLS
jgi:hypothetical protein